MPKQYFHLDTFDLLSYHVFKLTEPKNWWYNQRRYLTALCIFLRSLIKPNDYWTWVQNNIAYSQPTPSLHSLELRISISKVVISSAVFKFLKILFIISLNSTIREEIPPTSPSAAKRNYFVKKRNFFVFALHFPQLLSITFQW